VHLSRRTCGAILAVLVLGSPVAITADIREVPGKSECLDEGPHGDFRACLEQQARSRSRIVATQEGDVLDAISTRQQTPNAKAGAQAAFEAARKAFRTYKAAACEAEAKTAAGGIEAGELRLLCEELRDLEWLDQLKELIVRFTT
jgi:hypothetical protein